MQNELCNNAQQTILLIQEKALGFILNVEKEKHSCYFI
jgi:hypothetical protein